MANEASDKKGKAISNPLPELAELFRNQAWANETEKLIMSALGNILEIVGRYDSRPKGANFSMESVQQLIQVGIAVAFRLQQVSERDPEGMKRIAAYRREFPVVYSNSENEWDESLRIVKAIGLGEKSGFQADANRGRGRRPGAVLVRRVIREYLRDIRLIRVSHPDFELRPEVTKLFPPQTLGLPIDVIQELLALTADSPTRRTKHAFASAITHMVMARKQTHFFNEEIARVRKNADRQNKWHARKRLTDPNKKIADPKPSRAKIETILNRKILNLLEIDLAP